MGKDPALIRESTGCIDPPSRYLVMKSEDSHGVKWKNVTSEKMFEMVCEAVKKTVFKNHGPITPRPPLRHDITIEELLGKGQFPNPDPEKPPLGRKFSTNETPPTYTSPPTSATCTSPPTSPTMPGYVPSTTSFGSLTYSKSLRRVKVLV